MTYFVKAAAMPVGDIILAANEKSIVAALWKRGNLKLLGIEEYKESFASSLLAEAEEQLREYFSGARKIFDLPLEPQGTDFQKRVWKALQGIPFGKTISYQELARRVDSPRAVRAVGSANGKNPLCIFIPCHRVVRLTGEIGGYSGGLANKAFLLDLERRTAAVSSLHAVHAKQDRLVMG